LLKQGWHPQRTVYLCFWDGEEPALLGSTRMGGSACSRVEVSMTVAYFNSDGTSRGYFRAEGSSELENFRQQRDQGSMTPRQDGRCGSANAWSQISRTAGDARAELRNRPRHPHGGAGLRLRLQPRSSITLESPASISAMAVRTKAAASIIPSTTTSTGTPHFQDTDLRVWTSPRPNRRNHDDADGRRRCDSPSVWRPSGHDSDVCDWSEEANRHDARRDQRAQPRDYRRRVAKRWKPQKEGAFLLRWRLFPPLSELLRSIRRWMT